METKKRKTKNTKTHWRGGAVETGKRKHEKHERGTTQRRRGNGKTKNEKRKRKTKNEKRKTKNEHKKRMNQIT